MAWAQANMANARNLVQDRLYVYADVLRGTASSGSTTTITDVGTTDTVTLESAVYTTTHFVNKWVYVPAVAAPKQSRVAQYDRDAGTLTLSPALGATASAEPYEIHYEIPPNRLNDWIKIRAREGSSGAMTTIAEGTAINIDKFTLAEGVLADAFRYLAKRQTGEARQVFEAVANHHEMLWLRRLALLGLNPLLVRFNVQREDTEERRVLSRF